MFRTRKAALASAIALLCLPPIVHAQSQAPVVQQQQTGGIRGRILNTVTGAYVRNAEIRVAGTGTPIVVYSEEGGVFRVSGVPAGEATLEINYAGLEPQRQKIVVEPGQMVQLDVAMNASKSINKDVTELDSVRVTQTYSGQDVAIMEQRAAINAKNVVPADTFGALTMGDVGEFMKSMPGISLDYTEVDATAVRIGGLDPKYSTFTLDGARMATATSNNNSGRQNSFEQMSVTGIESIELNNTLTASMDADAPGGNINLRSKYAFDRTKRGIEFQLGGVATSESSFFSRRYFPDDKKHSTVYPSGQFSYGDVFMDGRFGLAFDASYNANYVQQERIQTDYAYYSDGRVLPYRIMWRPGPKRTSRTAANLGADFKINDDWTLSLRSAYSLYDVEYFNQYTYLYIGTTSTTYATDDSTSTHIVVNPTGTGSSSPRLQTSYSHRYAATPTLTVAPKLEFKGESTDFTLRGTYSTSAFNFRDSDKGFLQHTDNWLTRLGFTADRASEDSTAWYLTQTAGRDWSNPANFNLDDAIGYNIYNNQSDAKNKQYGLNADFTRYFDVGQQSFTLMAGAGTRANRWQTNESHYQRYKYVGPTGDQTDASSSILWTQKYQWEFLNLDAGNVNSLGWRADSNYAMYELFQEHPDWFVADTVGNLKRIFDNNKLVRETVNAAYIEGQTRWGDARFDFGLRYEQTRTRARVASIRPESEVEAAGLSTDTVEGLCYQYRCVDGRASYEMRRGKYDDFFLSGGMKYDFSDRLVGQLSFSQAILRPDYGNLGGVVSIDDDALTVTVPNSELKPERSTKYFAGLQYYLSPAGVLGASLYRLNIKDMQTTGITVDPEDVGFSSDEYSGYTFISASNLPGNNRNDGFIVEYSQQFTFLPGAWGGLYGRASYTRVKPDSERVNLPEKSANWGLGYRYGRFDVQVNGNYQSAYRISALSNTATTANNGILYRDARTMWNVSLNYKINDNFYLQLAGRNVFDEPNVIYSNIRSRVQQYDRYGSMWTFALRGKF